jgi:tRNA threonylcarbamoyladenosine modification (KEOPS) complex  Pcc1 subunit
MMMDDMLTISNIDLSTLSTADLRAQLADAITLTARHLQVMARIWRELEQRGEDLSSLRTAMTSYLGAIADGRLEAELVVRYAGHSMLLKTLSALPLERQRAILAGERLALVRLDAHGNIEQADVAPSDLPAASLRLVFAEGRIRPPQEQMRILMRQDTPKAETGRVHKVVLSLTAEEEASLRAAAKTAGRKLPVYAREILLSGLKRERPS